MLCVTTVVVVQQYRVDSKRWNVESFAALHFVRSTMRVVQYSFVSIPVVAVVVVVVAVVVVVMMSLDWQHDGLQYDRVVVVVVLEKDDSRVSKRRVVTLENWYHSCRRWMLSCPMLWRYRDCRRPRW